MHIYIIYHHTYDRVIIGDIPGIVNDGEDPMIDVQFTDEATAVTAHFSGFLSTRCGGVAYYEWAVGEGWGDGERESVMIFTEKGVVVVDSSIGSGYVQVCVQ